MPDQVTRRAVLRGTIAVTATTSLAALGFAEIEQALAQTVRPFKIAQARETRSNCTYCAVACGTIIYTEGDGAKNARPTVIHIEGDPDNPINRGTLCPKGSALLDIVNSDTRTRTRSTAPPVRRSGSANHGTGCSTASPAC